jgi:hypothetical protein
MIDASRAGDPTIGASSLTGDGISCDAATRVNAATAARNNVPRHAQSAPQHCLPLPFDHAADRVGNLRVRRPVPPSLDERASLVCGSRRGGRS